MPTTYIPNLTHYTHVLEKARTVQHLLWIGTADIKDLYVKTGLKDSEPFLKVLADLIKRGVEVRLIHAKEPGPAFREDFDKYPILAQRLERVLGPRVHFKLMIFDFRFFCKIFQPYAAFWHTAPLSLHHNFILYFLKIFPIFAVNKKR